jgi:hypothetical protein
MNVFLHRRQVVTDSHIDINENEISSITHGGRILEEGRDYTVSEGRLTLKANFLLSLPSIPLGEVAVLDCSFIAAPTLKILICQVDADRHEEKNEDLTQIPNIKHKALKVAIGSAGLLAIAAAAAKIIVSKRKPKL